jgi:purine nucleosidase
MTTLIHLDTDIGGDTDDLCALAMLLGWPEVELTGITTSAEVDGLRAGCAAYTLELAGRTGVPVVAGAAGSLGGFRDRPQVADPARYWPEPILSAPAPPGAALDLLAASIARGATIVAVGPYTNLALLEAARPGLLATASVVLMGGYVRPPRVGLPPWGPSMDYNVQADAVAARLVLERCSPVLVPLSATLEVTLREADLPALEAAGPLGRLIARQSRLIAADWAMQVLGRQYPALPDDLLNFQHDPLACAVAAGWDGARIEELPLVVEVQDGWLALAERTGGRPMRVVTAVGRDRFAADWLRAVARAGMP